MSAVAEPSAHFSSPDAVVNFSRPNTGTSTATIAASVGGGSSTRRSRVRPKARTQVDITPAQHGLRREMEAQSHTTLSSGDQSLPVPYTSPFHSENIPACPPRSPRRSGATVTQDDSDFLRSGDGLYRRKRTVSSGEGTVRRDVETRRGRRTPCEVDESRQVMRHRGLSVPRETRYPSSSSDSSQQPSPLTPSAFVDVPAIPNLDLSSSSRMQPRDSVMTQMSAASSSLYPPSSLTVSTTDSSPSSPSLASQGINDRVYAVDPDDNPHTQDLYELEADDVSYRLRLLVQNNYYLPPAHSKPFPSDISVPPATPKRSYSKTSAPAFLDIFKMGRSRAKIATPDVKISKGAQGSPPVLRTTSDSLTIAIQRQPLTARSLPPSPLLGSYIKSRLDVKGRVVVVRERMDDLVSAAKQTEQDLRLRESERNKDENRPEKQMELDDIIDPTDTVDIPPLPAGEYFFPPQASALNGLGIEASVGAAVLAERLPPHNAWSWSQETDEEAWRKGLLQEAVTHSLTNSPAVTPAASPATSTPTPSFQYTAKSPASLTLTAQMKQKLGQRIMSHIIDEQDNELTVLPLNYAVSGTKQAAIKNPRYSLTSKRASSGTYPLPRRVETPVPPPHPLAPPPRKSPLSPIASVSQGGSVGGRHTDRLLPPHHPWTIRKMMSAPLLTHPSEMHTSIGERRRTMTPPLKRFPRSPLGHESERLDLFSSLQTNASLSSGSNYSEDEQDDGIFHTAMEEDSEDAAPRPSFAISSPPCDRHSTDYSQPSPTVSAFHDALLSPEHSRTTSPYLTGQDADRISRVSSTFEYQSTRYSSISPPPRMSSSFSNTVLTPAPRPRTTYATPKSSTHTPSRASSPVENATPKKRHGVSTNILTALELPVSPNDSTSRQRKPAQLSLSIPGHGDSSIHSAHQHPSPISFFDEVEMQHRTMDLGSCDGEHSESEAGSPIEGDRSDSESAIVFVHPGTNAVSNLPSGSRSALSVLRSNNRSNPSIISSRTNQQVNVTTSYGSLDRRRPITNVLQPSSRSIFRSNRKPSEFATRINETAFELSQYQRPASSPRERSKPNLPWSGPRPKTSSSQTVRSWRQESGAQGDALRRLDGMVIEHIERERDTIRRITSTLAKS